MEVRELITPTRAAVCQLENKKRVLQSLSQMLADDLIDVEPPAILDALMARERLGSTGLGHGIALPHARMAGIEHPVCALIRLQEGINFEAMDNQPVDIFFALLVPEEANDEHLQLLAKLAELFSQQALRDALRQAQDGQVLYDIMSQHL